MESAPHSSGSRGQVAVLGAGITGLTAALHLRRAGWQPVMFESNPRPGGAIRSVNRDGWLHELGPNSLLESSPDIASFISDLGLAKRRLYASPAARQRFIVRGGRPLALPRSPLGFVTTPLFSTRAKLQLLREPWRPRSASDAEESVASFVLRRLGREFLDYAINPLVGGVYAGDPARLSVQQAFPRLHAIEQEYGSLIRGAIRRRNTSGGPQGRIFSFPNGLVELVNALVAPTKDTLRLDHQVLAISRRDGSWQVDCEHQGLRTSERFPAIVCALPADSLAKLQMAGLTGTTSLERLRDIEQPPVASVFLGYRREDVTHALDGFGMLIPHVEQRRILGSLFSSTLFPNRAPADHVALTSFVGGMRQPELTRLPTAELIEMVHQELRQLLGVTRNPVYAHVQLWPRAIPQYTLGYQGFKDAMAQTEACAPGLFIGGNCRDGISLGNCVAAGRRLADATTAFLHQHRSAPVGAAARG